MTAYFACRTCGKWVTAEEAVDSEYCSDDCTRAYSTCANCGKAFLRGMGIDGQLCSNDCAVRYQIIRKYGPQPVTVVTEVER